MADGVSKKFDPLTKKKGFAHFLAATAYSIGGFKCLVKEAAFRREIGVALALLLIYLLVGASLLNIMISLCLIFITFAIEALNTAIELLVDKASPEISDFARDAKDLGSFATMCLLVANGMFAFYAILAALKFI